MNGRPPSFCSKYIFKSFKLNSSQSQGRTHSCHWQQTAARMNSIKCSSRGCEITKVRCKSVPSPSHLIRHKEMKLYMENFTSQRKSTSTRTVLDLTWHLVVTAWGNCGALPAGRDTTLQDQRLEPLEPKVPSEGKEWVQGAGRAF